MPNYIINVTLQNGNSIDYERCAEELNRRQLKMLPFDAGYKKPLQKISNKFFALDSSLLKVTSSVSASAQITGKRYSFTIMREKSQ